MIDPRYMFGVLGHRSLVLGNRFLVNRFLVLGSWFLVTAAIVVGIVVNDREPICVIEPEIEIGQLGQMVDSYYLATSPRRYPTRLDQLTEGPSPLTREIPKDPWGNEYQYRVLGKHEFVIWSKGSDGCDGTSDDVYGYQQEPRTKDQRPRTTSEQEPKTKHQKPKTKNQEPKTKDQEPRTESGGDK